MIFVLLILLCSPAADRCIAGRSPMVYAEPVLCEMDKDTRVREFTMGRVPDGARLWAGCVPLPL